MIRAILLGITLSEAKLITLYPSSDVYVEAGAPTFSQLTSILQVGKMVGQAPEYRAFVKFDLGTLSASGTKVVSAKLRVHPVRAATDTRLAHHACVLRETGWAPSEVTWESMPDSQCSVTAAKPCCGDELGTFEPRLGKPAFVDVTYHTRLALGDKGGRLLAVELYPGLGANSKEDYFVQYGSSRRGDAATRPALVLDVIVPTDAARSCAAAATARAQFNGRRAIRRRNSPRTPPTPRPPSPLRYATGAALVRATAGAPSTFDVHAADAEGEAQTYGGDKVAGGMTTATGAVSNATIIDIGDGLYSAALTPVVAGSYALDVTINGKSVRDSPFAVQVLPGPTSPSHCVCPVCD